MTWAECDEWARKTVLMEIEWDRLRWLRALPNYQVGSENRKLAQDTISALAAAIELLRAATGGGER